MRRRSTQTVHPAAGSRRPARKFGVDRPGRKMQKRAKWAIDQCGGLVEERSRMSPSRRSSSTPGFRTISRLLEHRRRGVDSNDAPPGSPPRRGSRRVHCRPRARRVPVRFSSEVDIEQDVVCHMRRPLVVALRESLVPAHPPFSRVSLAALLPLAFRGRRQLSASSRSPSAALMLALRSRARASKS